MGCKDQNSPWDIFGSYSPILVTLGQQHKVGKKPTVTLNTYMIAMRVHQNRGEIPR